MQELLNNQESVMQEQSELREKYDFKLKQWMGHPVKHNVKVLLCTLPDILWADHGWERIAMDKLMTPAQVKKAHIKYIRSFHPDRFIHTGDQEKIFLANSIFAAIDEAKT